MPERSGAPPRPRDRSRTARRWFAVRCGLGSAAACQQTGSFVALPSAYGPRHGRARGACASARDAAAAVHRCAARGLPWEAAQSQEMGAICGKVETQGESRKEVEEDLRIDNRKRNSLIFAVIEWVSAVDGTNRVKDQEKLARSRRPTSVPSLPYDSCPSHDDLISRPFAGHDNSEETERHGDRHGRPQGIQTDEGVRGHRGGQLPRAPRYTDIRVAVREPQIPQFE